MSEPTKSVSPMWLIPATILLLCGLFPPEVRHESMLGCAALIALGALVKWPRRLDGGRAMTLLLTVLLVALSALFADSSAVSFVYGSQLAMAIAVGWLFFCFDKVDRQGRWIIYVLAATGTVAALHAIYQRLWGLDQLAAMIRDGAALADAESILVRAEVGRAYASFPTPAALGGYLVLTSAVLFGASREASGSNRILLVGVGLLQLIGIACSESVTAVASAFGALLLAALVGRIPRRWALIAAALGGVALVGVMLVRGGEVLRIGGDDTPWDLRARNARVASQMIGDAPWRGVGAGNFGERYPAYRQPGDNESQHVHNLPLEWSAELGLPIGILGSLIFFYLFLAPLLRRTSETRPAQIGVEIALAAFALQNLADFTAFLPSVAWTAIVLRVAIARRDALAWSWPTRAPAIASIVVVLLAAAVVGADAHGSEWARRSREAAAQGDWPEAERTLSQAQRWAPWNGDLAIGRAQTLLREDDERAQQEALDWLDQAVALRPHRASARYLRSQVRLATGDRSGAYADARRARELYPMQTRYQEWLDRLLGTTR